MAAKPAPPKPSPVHVYDAFVADAVRTGRPTPGFHHGNFQVPLTGPMAGLLNRPPGSTVRVRLRAAGALPVVLRTWQDESQILDALRGVLPDVPQCLARGDRSAVLSHPEGVPLSSICQNGKPVDSRLIEALAGLLARMVEVRRESLPVLPDNWPRDGHSRAFLRHLALLTEREVRRPNWAEFGGLFAALGIPENAMPDFADRLPPMVRRPFSLLHTDLHRDNVIVPYRGEPPLSIVDWELACYGDPLHDLATHLVRMRYPAHQLDEVQQAWFRAVRSRRPEAVNGMAADLGHYLDFERARSVYPDVMRAARSLGDERETTAPADAAQSVQRALLAAQGPLRLGGVPDPAEIARILRRWQLARSGRESPLWLSVRWVREGSRPGGPRAFSAEAVAEALRAEGAAPAHQVFKGTGHLNTVVHVRSADTTAVVRRTLRSADRREQCFNEESAVLRALEGSPVVRAPKVLALGSSAPADDFAIHSYEGPAHRRPEHPVDGLRLPEADHLVDQLAALPDVDAEGLAPRLAPGGFYRWLSDRLVDIVEGLPKESQRLATVLGLPTAHRLREILAGRGVTHRTPVLLHGDLNPWNLVRTPQDGQLALIDWEMAICGDPLHDLVRHLHLTPHTREIRQRMMTRWARLLGARDPGYVQGWQQDVHTYRWIEIVRSAYVDLDRLVTGASREAPNVRRAVDSYAMTLRAATAALGLPNPRVINPYLAPLLPRAGHGAPGAEGRGPSG
ncbi:aminoglycoside phosphotransferase family protein [Streptomyces candidus]|uniref:aminoglycoside phosphotransferase family protein n=1 Tax=Streptomyces candidus TaxID=67283 RepID=UPI0027E420C6|nr:aminoglycoside phosphotransferase family protein [Streptomyces candidus]